MQESRMLMGMPITVEIADAFAGAKDLESVFEYFKYVDETFSTYKENSEISRINRGELELADASDDMIEVFNLSEQTRLATAGYFDIKHNGKYDPSGMVKGWAIHNAAKLLDEKGFKNFRVEAGGDMELRGHNAENEPWRIGIRNPLNPKQIIKVIRLTDKGVATSGTYLRGQHIYNPRRPGAALNDIVSLTVIGPNIYEADRFATAAFAMGRSGVGFIEYLPGLEAYQIDNRGLATMTNGFEKYVLNK